jgi:hypothetical protein
LRPSWVSGATALVYGRGFFAAVALLELADGAQGLRLFVAEVEGETYCSLNRQAGRLVLGSGLP